MTKQPTTPADVAAARAACDDLRASMRSMMSLRNPRGRQLKAQLRASQGILHTAEARLLASITAENPAGNDRVTATIIMDARIAQLADPLAAHRDRIDAAAAYDAAHPESPFEHLYDADTGRLVQVRRDGK